MIGTITKQLTVVGLKIQFINLNILLVDKIRVSRINRSDFYFDIKNELDHNIFEAKFTL